MLRPAALWLALLVGACDGDPPPAEDCEDLLDCVEIDLLEAMAIAVEHGPTGVIVDAELSDEDGNGPIYDVDVYIGDGDDAETRERSVDAKTGEFLDDEYDDEDQVEGENQAAAIASSTSMITLPIAVETALSTVEGRAVSAELDVQERVIEVALYQDEQRIVVTIDLDSGEVEEFGG